ncbi:MAG: L-fuculokinase [Armatimonadetes bacterium]|nr:L-fuculokinase [Armatimonadota bacterium]
MPRECAVVFDCGSTNVTVVAVSPEGQILASASRHNDPDPQPDAHEGWLIWDMDRLWRDVCDASREALSKLTDAAPVAVTVTTWGADGAPVRPDGSLTYPPIAWACPRLEPVAAEFSRTHDPWETYAETGYVVIPFNTIFKLIWLRENVPQALEEAACWMMMPGLLSYRLCQEFSIDPTAAGTTMAVDAGRRAWSPRMLALADLTPDFFPRWCEPGTVIGQVTAAAAEQTGLPTGIPVVAAGHDTQFAAVGACAHEGEAILSSGTWEILMLRDRRYNPTRLGFEEGVIIELDAEAGLWNPQFLMMASGVIEWLRDLAFSDLAGRPDAYETMIREAEKVPPGSEGVTVIPSFVPSTGPTKKYGTQGTVLGLELATTRGHLYRAVLEGLSFQLRQAVSLLSEATGAEIRAVRVVGGGSKNPLWNQIRADVLGMPVVTIAQKEATVLGAALFALVGAGVHESIGAAQDAVRAGETVVEPGPNQERYAELFERYAVLPEALARFYKQA